MLSQRPPPTLLSLLSLQTVLHGRCGKLMRKYKNLIQTFKDNRRLVLSRIPTRYDTNMSNISRITGINTRVRDICLRKKNILPIDQWEKFYRTRWPPRVTPQARWPPRVTPRARWPQPGPGLRRDPLNKWASLSVTNNSLRLDSPSSSVTVIFRFQPPQFSYTVTLRNYFISPLLVCHLVRCVYTYMSVRCISSYFPIFFFYLFLLSVSFRSLFVLSTIFFF